MSDTPGPGGDGAGAGAGVGAGAGAGCGAEWWWRRRWRFFFFGFLVFFGCTGVWGARTAVGEIPPVAEPLDDGVFVGDTPPEPAEEVPVDGALGAVVPPVAALAAAGTPHASASASTAMASVERNRLPPCMGIGIGPSRRGA